MKRVKRKIEDRTGQGRAGRDRKGQGRQGQLTAHITLSPGGKCLGVHAQKEEGERWKLVILFCLTNFDFIIFFLLASDCNSMNFVRTKHGLYGEYSIVTYSYPSHEIQQSVSKTLWSGNNLALHFLPPEKDSIATMTNWFHAPYTHAWYGMIR